MSKLAAYVSRVQQEADDSDLTNLARAVLQVETEIAYLRDLKLRIEQCAERPKIKRPVEDVKALYDEAFGHRKRGRI